MLGPVSSHTAAETQSVVASVRSQPAGGRAFWRPPTGPRDATSTTRASASHRHSGHYAWVSNIDKWSASDPDAKARLLRQLANTGTPLWIATHGLSMGWTIRSGSKVRVLANADPRCGQLWAYCDDSGHVVVHRYRNHVDAGHVLQGDTCIHADPPVHAKRLIGQVVAVQRGARVRFIGRGNVILGACQRIPRTVLARIMRAGRLVGGAVV